MLAVWLPNTGYNVRMMIDYFRYCWQVFNNLRNHFTRDSHTLIQYLRPTGSEKCLNVVKSVCLACFSLLIDAPTCSQTKELNWPMARLTLDMTAMSGSLCFIICSVLPDKVNFVGGGGDYQWTSIPPRGGSTTLSCSMLRTGVSRVDQWTENDFTPLPRHPT